MAKKSQPKQKDSQDIKQRLFTFQTVGDLWDCLNVLMADPNFDPHAAYVYGPLGEDFQSFEISTETLSDQSTVENLTFSEA